ncbi:hypothetical protein Mapa_016911 [Marchantia paleacea]|nr:hypothetical protein Mapa_016911 [Marchantia paleacea]
MQHTSSGVGFLDGVGHNNFVRNWDCYLRSATFYRIFKKKATDSFSAIPYLCTLLNCVLWLLYGMPFVTKNGVLIMTINGIGAILEMSYLSIFMKYAPKPGKV